jgi:hypothetical protein
MRGVLSGIRMAEEDGRATERQGWAAEEQKHQSAMRPLQLEAARDEGRVRGMQIDSMERQFEDETDYRNGLAQQGMTPGKMKARQSINESDIAQIKADNEKFAGIAYNTMRRMQTASNDDERSALFNGLMTKAPHLPMSNEENGHPGFHVVVNSDPSKGKRGVWFVDDKGNSGGFDIPEGEDFNAATQRFIGELVNPERFAERWYNTQAAEKAYKQSAAEKAADRAHDLNKIDREYGYKVKMKAMEGGNTPSVTVPGIGNMSRDQAMQELTKLGDVLKTRTKGDDLAAMMAMTQIENPTERQAAMSKFFSGSQGQSIMSEIKSLAQQGDEYAQTFITYADALYRPTSAMGLGGQQSRPAPANSGMLEAGNINLNNRPVVKNADGTISTVRSMSINVDGREVLIPTVSDDGRVMTDEQAVEQFRRTGKHLGVFKSPEAATRYAEQLHNDQAAQYAPKSSAPSWKDY